MATLHEALQCLKPTSWDEVPQDPDELRDYVHEIFRDSRLVAESLPDPPLSDNHDYPGLAYDEADPPPRRIVPSSARIGETDPEITVLQKEWGKPIKMGGPKDNPLDVTVWKLSSNDGGGSWFGRRSVHEGLPFSRWRKKLSTEYDETLKVNRKKIEKGQTPDKSIRGIGAEEKIEEIEVKDQDGSVLGGLMVYHVSAQFPKPTAPRDFVALIINSDSGLQVGGSKQSGRSWMMISKPCEHPGIPHKQGYTRGEYESVELIREIPRKQDDSSGSSSSCQGSKKTSDSSSSNLRRHEGFHGPDESDGEDEEMNPVEWIMVTRSDPGGSIPRWMVDKGTPRSVGTDAAKFINWAMRDDKPMKHKLGSTESTYALAGNEAKCGESVNDDDDDEEDDSGSDSDYESLDSDGEHSHHGLIASVAGLLNTGLERFAPQVMGYGSHTEVSRSPPAGDEVSYLDGEGVAHLDPESARQHKGLDDESARSGEHDHVSVSSANSEQATPAIDEIVHNNMPPAELIQMTKNGKLNSNEKELAKLALRKREVERKLDEIRTELDKLQISSQPPSMPGTPVRGISEVDSDTSRMRKRAATNRSSPASTRTQQSQKQNQSESNNDSQASSGQTATPDTPAHLHKTASHLLSKEAKLFKQLRKLETSQLKVASKIETRQRKDEERAEKSKSKNKSEVDGLKQEVHDLKKEIKKLRVERQKWIDLVTSLQAENTKLVAKSDNS